MPILSTIGRRSAKTRLLVGGIYLLLLAGAVTMIWPFLLMLAGTTKSNVDKTEMRVVPRFLTDDVALWRKHVEGLFNESLGLMKQTYDLEVSSFEKLDPPAAPNRRLAEAWSAFLAEANLPYYAGGVGYLHAPVSLKVAPKALRDIKGALLEAHDADIERANNALGTDFVDWTAFWIQPPQFLQRRETPQQTGLAEVIQRYVARQPRARRFYFPVEGFYVFGFLKTQYTREIGEYNRAHQTRHCSYDEVHLDRRLPAGPGRTDQERADWEEFVRTIVNLFWVRADAEAAGLYRRLLEAKYADVETLNDKYGTAYASFEEVPLIDEPPPGGLAFSDWDAFLQGWKDPDTGEMHILPAEMIRLHCVDFLYQDWLKRRYGSIEGANAALGTGYGRWADALPPQLDAHWLDFLDRRGELRKEFIVRNFATVVDYIVLHGRGVLNTAIYCALAVLTALVVNPLAAYALSRYQPPSSYKVLLFLMLTMAFPPMVGMIPSFLMLREFGLLNTFAALILPGMANGYSIFLLKGFFDSQPKELYESAALDGAGEFRIFWQFTMSLSKPILAVIALSAFTMAYSNFMFALLTCQDRKMWTLMVWLYELQRISGAGVVYAALIVAAIPVLLMFILCQNIIMRGIVVPVEK